MNKYCVTWWYGAEKQVQYFTNKAKAKVLQNSLIKKSAKLLHYSLVPVLVKEVADDGSYVTMKDS